MNFTTKNSLGIKLLLSALFADTARPASVKRILLPLGAAFALALQPAVAQVNGNWNVNANGNWSLATNWTSNPSVPGGDGSIVNLTFDATTTRTITIDTTSRTVGQLSIGDPNGSHAYTLAASGGAGLIFHNGGSAAQLNFTSTALSGTVSAPISLADNLTVSNSSANQQNITSTISASTAGLKTLQITGPGAGMVNLNSVITNGVGQVGVTLNNSSGGGVLLTQTTSTFSGPFNLQAGRLILNTSNVTGTGVMNITGGSIESNGSNVRRISQNVTLNGSVTLGNSTNTGLVRFDAPASTINLTGSSVISTESAVLIEHIITGTSSSSLTKSGPSTLTLSGNHTYEGATVVSAGTLVLNSGAGINSSSQISIASGAEITKTGTINVTPALIFEQGAILSGTGSFTPISMTLVANLTGGAPSFSSIVTGTTSLVRAGNMEFTLSNPTVGDYTIFSGSAISGSFTSITVGGVGLTDLGGGNFGGTVGGFDYTFSNSTNTLAVIPEPSSWALLGIGIIFALVARRRSNSHKANIVG